MGGEEMRIPRWLKALILTVIVLGEVPVGVYFIGYVQMHLHISPFIAIGVAELVLWAMILFAIFYQSIDDKR